MKTVGVWIYENYLDIVDNAKIMYTLTGRMDRYFNYEAEMTMKEYERYNDLMNELGQ